MVITVGRHPRFLFHYRSIWRYRLTREGIVMGAPPIQGRSRSVTFAPVTRSMPNTST